MEKIRDALRQTHEKELRAWHDSQGSSLEEKEKNSSGHVLASESQFMRRSMVIYDADEGASDGGVVSDASRPRGGLSDSGSVPSMVLSYDCHASITRVGIILLAEDRAESLETERDGVLESDAASPADHSERDTMLQFVVYGIRMNVSAGDAMDLRAHYSVASMHIYDSEGEMASMGCSFYDDHHWDSIESGRTGDSSYGGGGRGGGQLALKGSLECINHYHESDTPDIPGETRRHYILPLELDTWTVTLRPTSLTGVTSVLAKVQNIFTVRSISSTAGFLNVVDRIRATGKISDDSDRVRNFKDAPKVTRDRFSFDVSLHGVNFKLPHASSRSDGDDDRFGTESNAHSLSATSQMMLLNIKFIGFKLGDFMVNDDLHEATFGGSGEAAAPDYIARHRKLMDSSKNEESLATSSLCILDVELIIVSAKLVHHSVFTTPLDLRVAIVSSLQTLNPNVTGLNVDVWVSRLSLSFNSDDLTAIIDSVEDVKMLMPGEGEKEDGAAVSSSGTGAAMNPTSSPGKDAVGDNLPTFENDPPRIRLDVNLDSHPSPNPVSNPNPNPIPNPNPNPIPNPNPNPNPAHFLSISHLAEVKMSEIFFEVTGIDVSLTTDDEPEMISTIRSLLGRVALR